MEKKIKVGDILYGTVLGIQKYGIFVELPYKNQGLIHISEARNGYVDNINRVAKIGDRVRVMVIDINEYNKKISLSLRVFDQIKQKRLTSKKEKQNTNGNLNKKIFYTDTKINLGFSTIKKELPHWIKDGTELIKKSPKSFSKKI